MKVAYLHCSCPIPNVTSAFGPPPDPGCPVHGFLPQEIARLRARLAEATGTIRDIAEAKAFDPIQWREWCRATLAKIGATP